MKRFLVAIGFEKSNIKQSILLFENAIDYLFTN